MLSGEAEVVGVGEVGVLGVRVGGMVVWRIVGKRWDWRVEVNPGGMVGWVGDGWDRDVTVDVERDAERGMDVDKGVDLDM